MWASKYYFTQILAASRSLTNPILILHNYDVPGKCIYPLSGVNEDRWKLVIAAWCLRRGDSIIGESGFLHGLRV